MKSFFSIRKKKKKRLFSEDRGDSVMARSVVNSCREPAPHSGALADAASYELSPGPGCSSSQGVCLHSLGIPLHGEISGVLSPFHRRLPVSRRPELLRDAYVHAASGREQQAQEMFWVDSFLQAMSLLHPPRFFCFFGFFVFFFFFSQNEPIPQLLCS